MDSLKTDKTLREAADQNYATDAVAILKGLKNQAKFSLNTLKTSRSKKWTIIVINGIKTGNTLAS